MSKQRRTLVSIMVLTMVASTFQIFAFAVLAADIIGDLNISRTALGLLRSSNTLVGALLAPFLGRLTDRIGTRRAIVAVMMTGSAGMALMAASSNAAILGLSAGLSGIAQGWGNPATNALIAERIPADTQGSVTGIKQSGVQVGIFLCGFTLPGLALLVSWRGAAMVYAVIFAVGAAVVVRSLEPVERSPATIAAARVGDADPAASDPAKDPIPRFIWIVALYAFLYGTAGGAIGQFFPLWANEVLGVSTVAAGALVALGGLLGIAARIWAGQLAQSRVSPPSLLSVLAMIGAAYTLTLLAASTVGSWILWPATILYSVGIGAWNAVAMLAVIVAVPKQSAGRASGVVAFGFLSGLTVGSPIAGWIVDRWDTYQPVWLGALALSVISALLIRVRPNSEKVLAEGLTST